MVMQHKVAVSHVDVSSWKGAENWLEGVAVKYLYGLVSALSLCLCLVLLSNHQNKNTGKCFQ